MEVLYTIFRIFHRRIERESPAVYTMPSPNQIKPGIALTLLHHFSRGSSHFYPPLPNHRWNQYFPASISGSNSQSILKARLSHHNMACLRFVHIYLYLQYHNFSLKSKATKNRLKFSLKKRPAIQKIYGTFYTIWYNLAYREWISAT